MKKAKRKKSPRMPTTVDAYIGARMRERRRALGITQERLGELLGVTFQQVQKYEKGANRVSAARLFEICKALEVTLASMFEDNPTACHGSRTRSLTGTFGPIEIAVPRAPVYGGKKAWTDEIQRSLIIVVKY
jgi:transcriptional regulator with XRE-family HTH domain